jgi:hypothetical protein
MENEEIAAHTPSDGRIQATHPTQIQQLQHQQTEMAVAIEPNNAAWPSTNNVNDKNQTAAIVDVNKKKDILIHLHVMDRLTIFNSYYGSYRRGRTGSSHNG